ncbi:MAG: hypothetical protein CL681_27995 [Blastopirellula sp.]|nr:hypothetical protein [Blastopirellula sp.]
MKAHLDGFCFMKRFSPPTQFDISPDSSDSAPEVALPAIQRREEASGKDSGRLVTKRLIGIASVGCLLGAVFAVWWMRTAVKENVAPDPVAVVTAPAREAIDPTVRSSPDVLADQLDVIELGVVKITSKGPGTDTTLGSGFVVDPAGLVATNYHVMAEATAAEAVFKDGRSYRISGYAAVDVDHDLAIVKLDSVPVDLKVLQLQYDNDPRQLSPVVAIGHPHGNVFSPFDGIVSRIVSTSELPQHSQRFLRDYLRSNADHRWIQHTAQISAGNSGGPLLNRQGEVIGVNTWVDREAELSYALHARYVRNLCEAASADVTPLKEHARQRVVVREMLAQLNAGSLETLAEDCAKMKWLPQSDADYGKLQQLAWAIAMVRLPNTLLDQGGLTEAERERLIATADRVIAQLRERRWDGVGHVTILNEYASKHIHRSMAGVMFFGTVERTVTGEGGTRGLLMQLAGTEQMLFLPLDGSLFDAEPGTTCLVLGVNYDGKVVRYGENPLRLITAPVIASRSFVPLP